MKKYRVQDSDYGGPYKYFNTLKEAKTYVFNASYRWCSTGGWDSLKDKDEPKWKTLSKQDKKESAECVTDHWTIEKFKSVSVWKDIRE